MLQPHIARPSKSCGFRTPFSSKAHIGSVIPKSLRRFAFQRFAYLARRIGLALNRRLTLAFRD
jgi:hypothetical protein